MSQTPVAPHLGSLSGVLATAIEDEMAALYRLQTAAINAHGGQLPADLRHFFDRFRADLKQSWDDNRTFLQQCYAFGDQVEMLHKSLGVESDEDCVQFLGDMNANAKAIRADGQRAFGRAEAIVADFAHVSPSFLKLLRAQEPHEVKPSAHNTSPTKLRQSMHSNNARSPGTERPLLGDGHPPATRGQPTFAGNAHPSTTEAENAYSSATQHPAPTNMSWNPWNLVQKFVGDYIWAEGPRPSLQLAQPNHPSPPASLPMNEDLPTLVDVSLDATRPDGLEALENASTALAAIASALNTACEFWKLVSNACETFVRKGKINVSRSRAAAFASEWVDYKQQLLESIASISKTGDAVVVHAVGAPSLRRQGPAPRVAASPFASAPYSRNVDAIGASSRRPGPAPGAATSRSIGPIPRQRIL